jgi:D-3-phosphoglycerate dehydrogenase
MGWGENRAILSRPPASRGPETGWNNGMKVLLTHTPRMREQYYGPRALAELTAMAEVILHQEEEPLTPERLVAAAGGADLIIADRLTTGPAEVFPRLPRLSAFLRCAVDIRNIDTAAASRTGVLVTRAGAGFVASVTELALGFLVDLSRGISRASADYHAGRAPEVRMGRQLSGSRIGIIGYGAIGRSLAQVAAQLGMQVLVSDPHARAEAPHLRQVGFETLMASADYVVCLAVATAATENLIDAAALARMKPDAVFINLSRGNLVDEAALARALTEGRIAGAAMDVGRASDQMPSPDLARLPNVIATPHIGGLTPPAIEAQAFDTVRQVRAILAGEVPPGAVNAEAWSRRPRGAAPPP